MVCMVYCTIKYCYDYAKKILLKHAVFRAVKFISSVVLMFHFIPEWGHLID